MSSFLIDGIVNTSVIDWVETENGLYTQFNKKKLSKHIRHYDPKYCDTFSKIYELPKNEVESAMQECAQLSSTKIYTILKNVLNKISKESFLKQN
jgi:ABC-type cobalt transport system substrate-binding protein